MGQIMHFVDLRGDESSFLAFVYLRVDTASDDFLPRAVVVDENLQDAFGNNIAVSHHKSVKIYKRCQVRLPERLKKGIACEFCA